MPTPSSMSFTGPQGARPGEPPLVAHIVYRFDTGGLENGVVNLINRMPEGAYRHMVIALTEVTDFRHRISRPGVRCIALGKPPGPGARLWPRLWHLLREVRPAVVHTRNLAALEMQPPAWFARVPVRIHGEHGRDVEDLQGTSRRLQRVRRFYAPFVQRYVALSLDLQRYLVDAVGIEPGRIQHICNGVDAERFTPASQGRARLEGCPFVEPELFIVGTVGRMQTVKDQTLLARAFVRALALEPALATRMRLVMVGDGPLRAQAQTLLDEAGLAPLAWLPGERRDVPEVMRSLDAFVLPSLAEGISNTILEAMATGLPVLATQVGGNAELVSPGRTGLLVPAGDTEAMAQALLKLARDPQGSRAMGQAGRLAVEQRFSLQAMVAAYQQLYDRELAAAGYARRS